MVSEPNHLLQRSTTMSLINKMQEVTKRVAMQWGKKITKMKSNLVKLPNSVIKLIILRVSIHNFETTLLNDLP